MTGKQSLRDIYADGPMRAHGTRLGQHLEGVMDRCGKDEEGFVEATERRDRGCSSNEWLKPEETRRDVLKVPSITAKKMDFEAELCTRYPSSDECGTGGLPWTEIMFVGPAEEGDREVRRLQEETLDPIVQNFD